MPILWVFESDVFVFRKACLVSKTWKIVFPRFIVTIYDMGIEWVTTGYKGLQRLQGVTRGYKGLQGGCKGLQVVTGGDNGLKGVTTDYRNFFLTRTFPDTFSYSLLHENQS